MQNEKGPTLMAQLKATELLQSIIASYRDMVYKLVIAHTGLVLTVGYFMGSKPLPLLQRCLAAIGVSIVGFLFVCWLCVVESKSNKHVREASEIWDQLKINPLSEPSGPRAWLPVILLPCITTLSLVLWICLAGSVEETKLPGK